METKTCKTCTHWSDRAPYGRPERFIERACGHDKFREDFFDGADDALTYSYQEGGRFFTGPNFGCVHYVKLEKRYGNQDV